MKIKTIGLAALTSIFATAAHAGAVQPQVVEVDLANEYAHGDQWTARNEPNEEVYIGCGMRTYDDGAGGSFSYGFCQAVDTKGNEVHCSTENPGLIDAIAAIDSFSYITFRWKKVADSSGESYLQCQYIGSSTQSFYLPKQGFGANN